MILSCTPVDKLVSTIKTAIPKEKPDCFIAIPSNCSLDLDNFRAQLKAEDISFVGAIYPFVFDQDDAYDDKILVKFYKFAHPPIFFDENCKGSSDLKILENDASNSLLLLSHATHPYLSNFLVDLFKKFGASKKVAGGCTIFEENKFGGNLFDANQIYNNYIVLIPLISKMQISLYHGWKEISGPYIVTKANGQTVEHLNWESANQVFAGAFPDLVGDDYNFSDLLNLAREFPFGMYKELGECIIRDPIQFTEKGITFLTEIPENTVLFILQGAKKSLFSASFKAVKESIDLDAKIEDHLIFNCTARKSTLEEDYKEELKNMSEVSLGNMIEGVYGYGEIGTNPFGFLEINNRSCLSISYYK